MAEKFWEVPGLRWPIIGITGPMGCGKTTVAEAISIVENGDCVHLRFADKLKAITNDLFGWTPEHSENRELKERPDPNWDGLTPRRAYQHIGSEVARALHPDVWTRYTMRIARGMNEMAGQLVIISDCRFDNEARAIREVGGSVWHLTREGLPSATAGHVSEKGVRFDPSTDIQFDNRGSLEELPDLIRAALFRSVTGVAK